MQIREATASDIEPVRRLLADHGWAHRVGDADRFAALLAASQRKVVALDDGGVVGFGRAITDGLSNGYLSMIVVAASHRRRGVGRAIVMALVDAEPGVTWVLRAEREGAAAFFGRLGFAVSAVAMERPRAVK